jgi:hypothetical protein
MSPLGAQRKELSCPSARCEEGAVLLGIVGSDGQVGYVSPLITIDTDFVRKAREGRIPESRFRFSQPCVEGRCTQWTGSRCGVIDQALDSENSVETAREPGQSGPPECVIRPTCRWFAQVGPKACAVCPLVVHTLSVTRP